MLDEVRFLLSLQIFIVEKKKTESELVMLVKSDDMPVTQIKRTIVYGCERYVVSQQTLIEGRSKKKQKKTH